MPRRDGFDTNIEMLSDFNATSHEVFVRAYERQFEDGVSPAFQDKPLNAVTLRIRQEPFDLSDFKQYGASGGIFEENPDILKRQTLSLSVLNEGQADDMRDHLRMKHFSQEVHDYYHDVARTLGAVTLSNTVVLRAVMPVQGTVASYTGEYGHKTAHGWSRHVDTFKEKPFKESLILGKAFAEESLEYVNSDRFEHNQANTRGVPSFEQARDAIQTGRLMQHGFTLEIRTDLPLNGQESDAYLREFAQQMYHGMTMTKSHLERFELLGAPDVMIDIYKKRLDEYTQAFTRVMNILDTK